jgi:plastocyanin
MKTKNILTGSLLAISAAIIITACYKNKSDYNNNGTNVYTVKMQNSAFSPASLTVTISSKVTWMNDDNVVHTVTASDGSFNSGDIAVGSSYSRTFTTAGTFNYYDAHNNSMTGVVVASGSPGGGGY